MTTADAALRQQISEALQSAAALHRAGDLDSAEAAYAVILDVDPNQPDALHLLGLIAHQRSDHLRAVELITRAIAFQPDTAIFHNSLGAALERLIRLEEAVAHYRRAIALKPDYAQAWTNLGIALQRQSRLDDAAAAYEHALALDPDNRSTHSHLLFCRSHAADADPDALAREHFAWAQRHADHLPRIGDDEPPDPDPDPGRRLRIGYVSPDFRHHPVANFIEPIVAAHDRAAVEVICYSDAARHDEVSERIEATADAWHETRELSDGDFARRVHDDAIDVLVDLAGHTRDHRLLAFARRPAPVQVTYLGYAATTGLAAIDYRITDEWADPEGLTEQLHSEQLVRLPHGFLCYQPPPYAPPLPHRAQPEAGNVVFGSFNKASKLTPDVLALWARILLELPDSKLVLKSVSFGDEAAQHEFRERFSLLGVTPDRLRLLPPAVLPTEHLALYGEIDVALDPFPYHGATSSCEALWMGAPVVSLAGASHAGRVGASILHAVGLDELVAGSPEEYLEIAVALANDPERLASLHAALRERMAASPLCDAAATARDLEDAYRTMWRRRCAQPGERPAARSA